VGSRGTPGAARSRGLAPEIVLASASPRRAALLAQIGLPHRVHPSQAGEEASGTREPHESPEGYAVRLALAKARDVAGQVGTGLVVGADTVVVRGRALLGKPHDPAEAHAFLLRLSGRTHRVTTGVAVVEARTGRAAAGASTTRVRMRRFGPDEAARYVATGEPLDKAGAYGIQGRGALLIDAVCGDYFTVVGLPLVLVADLLGRFGVDVWGAAHRTVGAR
jgi:septum formation protein